MIKGMAMLYSGDFNSMDQERHGDGTVIITLAKEGENVKYRFQVRDLYGEHEQVLSHEVIPGTPPKWIIDRMEVARKHDGKYKG